MKKTTKKTTTRKLKVRERNRTLTHDNYVDLCLYVQPRAEELRAKPPVFAKLAPQLSEALGFPVAPTSLAKVCRRFGVVPSREVSKPLRERCALEERVASLEDWRDRVTRALEAIGIEV